MQASLALLCPKSVTSVLNLLCYLCSEPAPDLASGHAMGADTNGTYGTHGTYVFAHGFRCALDEFNRKRPTADG
jgi:hypothetical protein